MRSLVLVLGSFLGVAVAACGGDSGGSPDGGDRRDGPTGATAGEIVVLQGGGYGHLAFPPVVFGDFPDVDGALWYQQVLSERGCRVDRYQPGLCTPACTGVCVDPGECRPYPTYRSAGALTIGGLTAPLTIDPPFDGRYHTFGGLPDPLFAPGATITAVAGGATIPEFAVSVAGPRPLSLTPFDGTGVAVLRDGADLRLTWTNPDPASQVRLFAHSGGALHGTPPAAVLECDVPDTGALTIPRAAIEAMPPLARGCGKMHDCAKLGVMRYRRATVATAAGEVALRVGSGTDYQVEHAAP